MYKIWNEDIKESEKGNYLKAFELIEEENNAFKERVFKKLKTLRRRYVSRNNNI